MSWDTLRLANLLVGWIIAVIVALAIVFGAGVLVGAYAQTLPDPTLTPGKTRALSTEQVCTIKWGKDRRHVTAAMKREVLRRYGRENSKGCELDHLIPRELGGADDVLNLWPQCPYSGEGWTARAKDRLENKLNREVCLGNLSLRDAQDMIRIDWTVIYRAYFGEPK